MIHDSDPFAERLREQPPSSLPPAWRAEILAAATAAIPPGRTKIAGNPWTWSLAAAWAVIVALRLLTPGSALTPAVARSAPTELEAPPALAYQEFTLRALLLAGKNPEEGLP